MSFTVLVIAIAYELTPTIDKASADTVYEDTSLDIRTEARNQMLRAFIHENTCPMNQGTLMVLLGHMNTDKPRDKPNLTTLAKNQVPVFENIMSSYLIGKTVIIVGTGGLYMRKPHWSTLRRVGNLQGIVTWSGIDNKKRWLVYSSEKQDKKFTVRTFDLARRKEIRVAPTKRQFVSEPTAQAYVIEAGIVLCSDSLGLFILNRQGGLKEQDIRPCLLMSVFEEHIFAVLAHDTRYIKVFNVKLEGRYKLVTATTTSDFWVGFTKISLTELKLGSAAP